MAIFRPYSHSDSLRSDRSAADRLRHRQKVRQAIRNNVADIVAEESIIGKSGDKVIKVPIRGVKEYRFVFGNNTPQVGSGDGNTKPGQVVGKTSSDRAGGPGPAGDQPGTDYYETDVTLEELIDIMFEDLELPEMQRKTLREVLAERTVRRKGYRKKGIRVHLDKKRTAISRIRRKVASRGRRTEEGQAQDQGAEPGPEPRLPFHWNDVKYRRMKPDLRPQSNAVVLCIMDTSASMDTVKKYLARSFFFLLYQFVRSRYAHVEVVFVAHHTEAREVSESEFFHKGESGGTRISSGYLKALQIMEDRFHPTLWNVYAFHCSDGDNWPDDNDATLEAAARLCELCNLFGYGEIKPQGAGYYGSSMLDRFKKVPEENFQTLLIETKQDIWPAFKKLLSKETEPGTVEA